MSIPKIFPRLSKNADKCIISDEDCLEEENINIEE